MWFATYDGVNKYDGYSFTVYQHNEEDPNSIANDISRIVKTDSQGRVWIGTRDGLSYYDEEKDKFRNFFYEKKGKRQQINGIAEISPEQLLISTQEGLTMFDIKESKFVDDSFSTAMHKLIASALYRQGDIIYIGTPVDGLYSYSIPQKKLEKITPITETKQIQAILQQSPTRIWVATEGAGLLLLNPKTKEVKAYHHSSSNPKSISSNYIRSLALDSQNRLWIGTFNDLNIYHEGSDSFVSYSSSPVENGSLSQRSVRSIFMDSQGGMWLGTYFGGLNYYHPIRNRFKNIQRIPYKNSLSDNVVSCITEDKDKNLWIGTNDGGLNLYNTKTQQFTHYILQEDEREIGIGSNNIKAVYVDEQKSLVYIGTHAGGLTVLHRNSGKMESFNQLNSQLVNENVYAILPDKGGNLLLGTLSALVSFNPEKKSFTTIDKEKDGTPFTSQRITILFRDSHKRLWIGGEEGISVFQQEGLEIEKVPILPESSVTKTFTNCIYEADNGIIWVGTREGFYCFNEKEKKIKRYTTANGLPNNVVYGVLEDTFGRLWVSTNRELHNIIILIDAESFHIRSKIKQLHQAAGSIFFRSQDSLKFKSLKHRFMYGINSTGKDSGNLFLLQ
jgi:ligand-binding sensor domain-containing protein